MSKDIKDLNEDTFKALIECIVSNQDNPIEIGLLNSRSKVLLDHYDEATKAEINRVLNSPLKKVKI